MGKGRKIKNKQIKTTGLKIRDAWRFVHQNLGKFDQNAASQQGAVVSASALRRGGGSQVSQL